MGRRGSSPPPFSQNAPHFLLILLLLLFPSQAASVNVTAALAAFPAFSDFNRLLSSSAVAAELGTRSSVTLLALNNTLLSRSVASLGLPATAADMADVIRFHVLLQYISWRDLGAIPAVGELVTTLYQTTGRAAANLGSLNLSRSTITDTVTVHSSSSNATIISMITSQPYNLSIFSVDSLLLPYGFDLFASESQPSPSTINVTRVLTDGKDFNVVTSMLAASGVTAEFEADERVGPGITIFAPTDEAFASQSIAADKLQSLSADRKAMVLRFHVLHSYYPLGSLESMVNPIQPTLATESTAAGRFTLNITRINGSIAIDTGLVQASITRTVFDQNPVAVFAVSRVLLPREIFSEGGGGGSVAAEVAPPPAGVELGMAPEFPPPTRLSSPPGERGDFRPSAAPENFVLCIGFWSSFVSTLLIPLLLV